ncbi:MAG TPA: hypothetical protein VJL31_17595, partial [Gemmatimonadales bacterium]|nr:hypothetical protein [Gemmatimonadales bacterium]
RRTWIRGLAEVGKRYLMAGATHNLGLIVRAVFGVGTPRSLQGSSCPMLFLYFATCGHLHRLVALPAVARGAAAEWVQPDRQRPRLRLAA